MLLHFYIALIEKSIIFVQEEHYIALFDSVLLIRFENGYN